MRGDDNGSRARRGRPLYVYSMLDWCDAQNRKTYTASRLVEVQGSPRRIVRFEMHKVIFNELESVKQRARWRGD